MTPPCDITSQLRTRIQQAVTTVCELEVTYKCSLQIFGVLCFSIDGDDDNEFIVKIQKKWCKASMHDVSDYHNVTLGVNATLVRCNNSKTFPECRKQSVQSPENPSNQHQISCDTPETADSFPRSFRPIPSSDVSYDRNTSSSIADVCYGFHTHALEDGDSPNIRTSYPLCPYDSCNDFPELTQQGLHNVQLGNKGAFVKHCVRKDSPLACRYSRPKDENDTQAHTTNLVGSAMGKAMECDLTTLHKSTLGELSDSEGMPVCVVNHSLCGEMCPKYVVCDNRPVRHVCELKPVHPDRLLSTTSTENVTSFTQTYELVDCIAPAKQTRHMFIPAEVLATSANADHTHSSMFSRKASYTEAKLYGTARTGKNRTGKIQRRTPVGRRGIRLPGCPLVGQRTMAQCFGITKNKRLTYTNEEQVELEHGGFAWTMQRLLCRPPLRVDGALVDGTQRFVNDDAMENVQNVNVASKDEELDLPHRAMPPEGRLSRVEFGGVDSSCDNMTTNTAGNIPFAVLQRQDCHRERELDWKMHRVTYDTDKSESGTAKSHIQTTNTDDPAGDDLRIFLQHTGSEPIGGVGRSGNVNENEHQYRCVSVTNGRTDAGKNACFGKEQNMSSDVVVLCKQRNKPDGKITETTSVSAEVSKPVSQADSCTNENQTTEILCKTSCCYVDTNCKIMSMPVFGGTDIVQVIPRASENIQKTCEELCKTNGIMSSELHRSNQMPPMKTCLSRSDNTCTEPVHDEMNSQKCHYDTAGGVSISACKHATDDDIRSSNRMTFAVDSNSGNVDDITEDLQEREVTDEHVSPVPDDQCRDISVDSDCSHIGSDTHRNPQDPVEDPQRNDTPTHPAPILASVTSHDHNQTPGKHVRNLFPEHSECADFTRSKDATCVANKDLLFNSFPVIRLSARVTENSLVSDNAETLEPVGVHCTSKFRGTADDLSPQQMSTVPRTDEMPIVSEGLSLECNTAVCLKHDKDNLTRSFDEPVQKFCGFGTSCVDIPDAFSSSATTRVCGAYLLSPLTRPPIHRLDRKDTGGHIPVSTLSKESQLCRDSKHNKETSVQCLDALLKYDEQAKVALAKVSGCHTESISLGSRLSCEEPRLKSTNSEATEATPPDQRALPDPSNKELQGGKTGMSQLSPTSDTSGINPLNAAPRAKPRFTAEPPCLFSVGYSTDDTESCGGSSESCSDCSGQLVNVTGSWSIVPHPDPSSSLATMSRPLVTVTSFSNIQFKDIRFDSSTDKNAAGVPDDVFLPCAVKENRRDGFLRRSQLPKTRGANRRSRWKWPANLLRTISRRSHVVTKRHHGATPESVCLEKMKVKGRWTRKWRPGSGSP